MSLQITGRHMTIEDTHKSYIDKKVNRLRRLCTKIDEMSVTLTREKIHFKAEATFRAGAISARAATNGTQPLEAIDLLVDKLESQVTKAKDKWDKRKGRGRERLFASPLEGEEEEIEETEPYEDYPEPEVGEA